MANLRIIARNLALIATLSASSTAGALAVTNLQTSKKSDVWRAAGTAARIDGTLPAAELASGVALLGNFSPATTIRVRLSNELPATNQLTAPNEFTNAAWTRSSLTATTGAAGPDGANGATTLTATAGGAEIKQARTVAAGPNTSSIFIRRRAGTGVVSIRNAANTGWIPLTLNGAWSRVSNDGGATGTSALVNLQIAIAGDAVDIAFAQLEAGAVATSYYPGARPAGYIDAWQSYDYDSGMVPACPAPAVQLEGWTAAKSASAYAYGGGAYARAWFPVTQFRAFAIDLVDTNNAQGYIEAAQLVIGQYWAPTYNPTSASATDVDATTHYRTDAGDLMSRASTVHKKVSIELQYMPAEDRATLANILRGSRARPVFFSLFPGHADLALERDHTLIGKRMSDSEVAVQMAIRYGTKLDIESI
jgi:hypothetical protein